MMTGTPIVILREGTTRESGKGATSNNIAAAKAVADAVKTTLAQKAWTRCSWTVSVMWLSPTTEQRF